MIEAVALNGAIDRDGPRALYLQVAERIASACRERYRAGERIPAESELMTAFGVARHTLRHAIDVLEQRGVLERRRGLGTFVLPAPLPYPLHAQARFSETIAAQGRARESRLMAAATEPAGRYADRGSPCAGAAAARRARAPGPRRRRRRLVRRR